MEDNKTVLVFDDNAWMKTGDIGDNSCFWKEAVIISERESEGKVLVDVRFVDDGRISNGHYKEGIKKLPAKDNKTKEEILLKKVGKLSLAGLKWKSLEDRKHLIYEAMDIYAEQVSQQSTKHLQDELFKWKQLIDDHKKYELFDLTDEQREKLKGEYVPGCKATIYWHFKDDGHNFKLKDAGYCFDLPGMAGDYYDDFFVHIPIPDGQEKEANEPVWVHINCLLSNKDVTKVVLNTKS